MNTIFGRAARGGRYGGASAQGASRICELSLLFLLLAAAHVSADIVINEIMYHPYQPYPVITNRAEYIEIYNSGATTVDLTKYRFDNGVDFTFPAGSTIAAGGYKLICEDLYTFTNAYPAYASSAVGEYQGSLNNNGERLTLSRKEGDFWVTNDSIKYADWSPADGDGHSIELVNQGFARMDEQVYGAWLPSLGTNGTPGQMNSVYSGNPAPAAGEVTQDPPIPFSNSVVTITALAASRLPNSKPTVTLQYRVDANPPDGWSSAGMADDGYNGDAAAGDGYYAVRIPPYGTPGYSNDTIVEFKIQITDTNNSLSLTIPATNTAGVSGGVINYSMSYLCYFGEAPNFSGEYPSYRVLMTQSNRNYLEARGVYNSDPLDCTLVASGGKVFHNSSVRYRGDSSRTTHPIPIVGYRVTLPKGRTLDGLNDLNFAYGNPFQQYIAHRLVDMAGHGAISLNPQLCKFFVNQTQIYQPWAGGMFMRFDTIPEAVESHFADNTGNIYGSNGGQQNPNDVSYYGDLTYLTDLNSYKTAYFVSTNNPSTIYVEMSNLCWCVNQIPSGSPPLGAVITNRVKVGAWGGVYAGMTIYDNQEGGFLDPTAVSGDEIRLYCDPSDGRFQIFPWDPSEGLSGTLNIWSWNYAGNNVIRNFLFNRPIAPYYIGACWDILENKLSDERLRQFMGELGSAALELDLTYGSVTFSNKYYGLLSACRTNMHSLITTNLSVTVDGSAVGATVNGITVSSATPSLTGRAPMQYTQKVLVQVGANAPTEATWDAHSVSDMQNSYGKWTLAGGLSLSPGENKVLIRAMDDESNDVKAVTYNIVYQTAANNKSGAISVNTTWDNSAGVIHVTGGDVTINPGVKLTIAANTVVMFDSGRKITANGTLEVQGTSSQPVYMLPSDHSPATTWTVESGSGGSVTGNYVMTTSGGRFVASSGGTLSLVDSTLANYTGSDGIVAGSGSGLTFLSRCIVTNYAKMAFSAAPAIIDQCLLMNMSDAGVEFSGAASQATVRRTTIKDSWPVGSVDGVRYTTSTLGLVTNCEMHDLTGNAVEIGASGAGVKVCYNVMYECGAGVFSSAGSAVLNNTIEDCISGLVGTSIAATNNIIWNNLFSASNGPSSMAYSDVEVSGSSSTYSGTGNINKDPFFRDVGEGDHTLLTNNPPSPCRTSGQGGTYMGALASILSTVGATPVAPTGFTATNNAASIILQWTDNSSDEKWFEVQRSKSGNNWDTVTNVTGNTFTDTTAEQDTLYYYRVRAAHERGESFFADEKGAMSAFSTNSQDLVSFLRITEIMYAPNDGTELHEFIELKNISGTKTLALSNCYFSAGIDYVFPAGATLGPNGFYIIAVNGASFSNWYSGKVVNGIYGGGLNNGGEQLRLRDSLGATVCEVNYNDNWYPTTDGEGYSLVIVDASVKQTDGNVDNAPAWRPSTNLRGSPMADDPAPSYGNIVINELIAHADSPYDDAIEVRNVGTTTVNIAGWYFSNDETNLKKYQITNGTLNISAGGYYVFYGTTSFNSNTSSPSCFNIGELGGSIYLSSASGTNLTSYRTKEDFDATDNATNGVSMGRYVRSDSNVDFTVLSPPTFGVAHPPASLAAFRTGTGASNAYPKVGPVVISEIMYNPAAGGNEYVEICNMSGSSVALYDSTYGHASNTWKVTGGVSYTFPTNKTLAAGAYALVVSIDPALFRTNYGVNPSVQVFGPFDGALANNDDTVNLKKPGDPQVVGGFVPYYVVDHVHYYDTAPWPTMADNSGASLERIDLTKYGNDPTNWVSASVGGTPGAANNSAGLPSVGFEKRAADGFESNEVINVNVMLVPAYTGVVTVGYTVGGGTASSASDYETTMSGTLTFSAYETNKVLRLRIKTDGTAEADETVQITLSGQSANARLGGNSVYAYTIKDPGTAGEVTAPTISPAGTNIIMSPVQVTMSCTDPNVQIYYTTDGSYPTPDDNLYTGLVTVANSARVSARSYLGSRNASAVKSALFLLQTGKMELASPRNDTAAFAPYTPSITANVYSVSAPLQKVEFFVNGSSIGNDADNAAPYVKTGTVVNGQQTLSIYAVMTDASGPYQSATVSVNVYTNVPTVEAGSTNRLVNVLYSAQMDGYVNYNGWSTSQVTATWSKYNGPGAVTFDNASSPTASATFSQEGMYELRLAISYSGNSSFDFVTVQVVSSNAPSRVPFYESFEPYGNGTTISGLSGWEAPASAAVVVTNNYTNAYKGTLPISGRHQLVLRIDGSATNVFEGADAYSNLWFDMMFEGIRCEDEKPPSPATDAQFALYVNSNGQICVWNKGASSNTWTALTETRIGSNEWFRLTVEADYTRVPNGFLVYTNGIAVTNTRVWFDSAYSTNHYFSLVDFTGEADIDDLVVQNSNPFTGLKSIFARIFGIGGGSIGAITSTGTISVATHATTNLMITRSNWFNLSSVVVDSAPVGTPTNYLFSDVTADHTIDAYFTAQLAASNTPKWWLVQYYANSNQFNSAATNDLDGDGMKGWEEFIGGTIPTDGDSVLRILKTEPRGSGQRIYWQSVTDRYYSVHKSTNLLNGWLVTPLTSSCWGVAGGTNIFDDASSTNVAAFYKITTVGP